jgi:hypothetical protein
MKRIAIPKSLGVVVTPLPPYDHALVAKLIAQGTEPALAITIALTQVTTVLSTAHELHVIEKFPDIETVDITLTRVPGASIADASDLQITQAASPGGFAETLSWHVPPSTTPSTTPSSALEVDVQFLQSCPDDDIPPRTVTGGSGINECTVAGSRNAGWSGDCPNGPNDKGTWHVQFART